MKLRVDLSDFDEKLIQRIMEKHPEIKTQEQAIRWALNVAVMGSSFDRLGLFDDRLHKAESQ